MDLKKLQKISEYEWRIERSSSMNVPGILFGDQKLIQEIDEKVKSQIAAVASLPGVVKAVYAMPDAHWGYGFPIGGVAAFDPDEGGVVSAGGVGFDISCGVRTMVTGISYEDFAPLALNIADALFANTPCGVGGIGKLSLTVREMDQILLKGASWAISRGYGVSQDLDRIEMHGVANDADPDAVSSSAKNRQLDEMGTLGSGNHYLEVQCIDEIYNPACAAAFGLRLGEIVISIHCGSRGLGHQVATDYSKIMLASARRHQIELQDRELACAPIHSEVGQRYLGAMRAAINCALANRQILSHIARQTFSTFFPKHSIDLLYDVSHNTCLEESHEVNGKQRNLFVHRKGATRALPPGHEELCPQLRPYGQPVLVGGSMGTASYILSGTKETPFIAFSSACHGAGRQMSRTQALHQNNGNDVVHELAHKGILIRCKSYRGVAEEAPSAYKDVNQVVLATDKSHLAGLVARLRPVACIKG